jgi:hypothetical protein
LIDYNPHVRFGYQPDQRDATMRAEGVRMFAALLAGAILETAVDAGPSADQTSATHVNSAIGVVHAALR